jgi:hypothetical protein
MNIVILLIAETYKARKCSSVLRELICYLSAFITCNGAAADGFSSSKTLSYMQLLSFYEISNPLYVLRKKKVLDIWRSGYKFFDTCNFSGATPVSVSLVEYSELYFLRNNLLLSAIIENCNF